MSSDFSRKEETELTETTLARTRRRTRSARPAVRNFLPPQGCGGRISAPNRPKPHFTDVFSFSNRPKGSFLSDGKHRFCAVSTGSGTIWRRSKIGDEKLMKFQEKPVNTGLFRRKVSPPRVADSLPVADSLAPSLPKWQCNA